MSRSYWRYIAAAAGLVVLLGLLKYGFDKVWEYEQQPYSVEKYQPARDARLPIAVKNTKIASSPYEPNCQAPESRENAELCSQWQMVEANEEGNRLVRMAIGLAYWEFVGLVVSLFLSGWAAIAAIRAARASEQTITITREMGYAQSRAYLAVDGASIYCGWLDPYITLKLFNTGTTPAKWTEIESNVRLVTSGTKTRDTPQDFTGCKQRWPGDPKEHEFQIAPTCVDGRILQELLDDTSTGRQVLVLQGTLRWETMFGEIFESEFYFFGAASAHRTKKTDDGEVEIPARMTNPCLPLPAYRLVKMADEPKP